MIKSIFFLAVFFLLNLNASVQNPHKNISSSDKINALIEHFIKKEIDKLPRPPKELNLKKGMFEKKADFNIRVKKEQKQYKADIKNYQQKVSKVKTQAQKNALRNAIAIVYGVPKKNGVLEYDTENEHFFTSVKFKDGKTQKIAIKVPLSIAEKFYQNYKNISLKAVYKHSNSSLALKNIVYSFEGKNYEALFTDSAYKNKNIAIKIKSNFNINTQIQSAVKIASYDNPEIKRLNEALLKAKTDKSNQKEIQRLKAELAKAQDVAVAYSDDLPNLLKKTKQAKTDKTKWLFIVGIGNYEYTQNISFSKRSAKMFKEVMKKSLGIPEDNIYTLLDKKATSGTIKNRLSRMLRKVSKGDTIYFYYNGHGIPIPAQSNEPYMLAQDIEPDFIVEDDFFALKNFYKKLSDSKAGKVVAFVDSCFSGGADGKTLLKGVAAARLKPKKVHFDKQKMVVLSAGENKQYSNPYNKKGHRLFSYFIMRSILAGNKDINSIHKSTYKNVKATSHKEYGDLRAQTPTVDGNRGLRL